MIRRIQQFWRSRVQHRYWITIEPADATGEFHVIPNRDLIQHEAHDCPCGVTSEAHQREDGSYGWVIIHHSLDGREAHERA